MHARLRRRWPRPPAHSAWCRRVALGAIICVGVLVVDAFTGAAVVRAQALSPGPLANPHAKYDNDDSCLKCHSAEQGVPDAKCLDCHTVLDARIRAGKGYHGRTLRGRPCTDCHKDHLGRGAELIRWPGGSPERFTHALTGFNLIGSHNDIKCRDCHTKSLITDPAAAKIPNTYLGLPTTCNECHKADDPHDGEFAGRTCTDCHGQEKWTELTAFDHDRSRFPLVGKHRDVECKDCHQQPRYTDAPRECNGCHETPHPERTRFGSDCASCHTPEDWTNVTYAKSDHSFFPLVGGHQLNDCADCHGDDGNAAPQPDCNSCHDDVHSGRFGTQCQSCHNVYDWRKINKNRFDHDKTNYPLRGQHVSVQCNDCHPNGKLKPIAHDNCTDCHQDAHDNEVGQTCEDCHVVQGFRPSTYPIAKHTTFALTGAHEATGCDDCHRIEDVWRFRKGVIECHECHQDRHEGQFEERKCTECHVDTHWTPASAFDHDAVWALEGKHVDTACNHCHADGQYAKTPRGCDDCHGTPHLGQFIATPPRKECTDCHTPAGWTGTYDHTEIWPLEGAHAEAECKECHKEVAVAGGRVTVRWRLGFQDCARCHSSPHRDDGGAL